MVVLFRILRMRLSSIDFCLLICRSRGYNLSHFLATDWLVRLFEQTQWVRLDPLWKLWLEMMPRPVARIVGRKIKAPLLMMSQLDVSPGAGLDTKLGWLAENLSSEKDLSNRVLYRSLDVWWHFGQMVDSRMEHWEPIAEGVGRSFRLVRSETDIIFRDMASVDLR